MDAFLSSAAAKASSAAASASAAVKAGVQSIDVESLESSVVGKMSAALEKVESVGGAALENAGMSVGKGGTPARPSAAAEGTPSGKRTLESLDRDELLLVAQRELKKSKELKAGLERVQAQFEESSRVAAAAR